METRSKTNNFRVCSISSRQGVLYCMNRRMEENETIKKHNFCVIFWVIFSQITSGAIYSLRLVKKCLKSSGINVLLFTAPSTCSAKASKASASGLSMTEMLERETWSNKSTWQRLYKKDNISIHEENFQNRVKEET